MEPIDARTATVMELMDWIRWRETEAMRWMEMMKLLRYDKEEVVEIAERLLEDGWVDSIESLVLAARLLGDK